MNKKNLNPETIIEDFLNSRKRHLYFENKRIADIYDQVPVLKAVENERNAAGARQVQARLAGDPDALPNYHKKLAELNARRAEIMKAHHLTAADFEVGAKLDITGTSKGKGTQGNIKRHHHRRGPMTHGSKHKRLPGGLAAATYPSRVFRGNKAPGRTGRDTVTMQNLELVKVIADRNLMLVKGAVPGNKGGLLRIKYAVKGQTK